MLKYSILGYPLKHTMSPPIHDRLFRLAGINDFEYIISEIPPDELKNSIEVLNSLNGYNVTIPYKMEIIQYLDKLDASAKRYNSVNCVVKTDSGNVGYNTDCYGFLRALEAENASLSGKVLLLGCGGVGRMMAIETALHGGKLTIAVRKGFEYEAENTIADIKQLAPSADVCYTSLDSIEGQLDLLVNSTPVGMYPNVDDCPVSEDIVKNCRCAFDAVYNPEKTKLMQLAEKNGIKAIGGMSMLVWQAVVAHEIWDGSKYNDKNIAQIIAEMHKLMK